MSFTEPCSDRALSGANHISSVRSDQWDVHREHHARAFLYNCWNTFCARKRGRIRNIHENVFWLESVQYLWRKFVYPSTHHEIFYNPVFDVRWSGQQISFSKPYRGGKILFFIRWTVSEMKYLSNVPTILARSMAAQTLISIIFLRRVILRLKNVNLLHVHYLEFK